MKNLKRKLLSSAISCLLPCTAAYANPAGPHVVDGTANFVQQDAHLAITNSNGAVINWQSFSISQGETTHFNQPSADSSVLNRVTGSDPSHLLGELSSNGKVYLVNPSGILVGEGAKIDVAGFVGSNLNITNENFKAGNLKFEANEQTSGKVENLGDIHTPNGGSVYLVGSEVSNQGVIQTPQGEIILAAGQTVEIHDTATPGVTVAVTGNSNQVTNLGQLVAASGQIGVIGAVVQNSGVINANQMVTDESGRVFLKATQNINIATGSQISADANSSVDKPVAGAISVASSQGNVTIEQNSFITANGPAGGSIQISAEQGSATLAGHIQAVGSSGSGGSISSIAASETVATSASLDVSGKMTGGQISLVSSSGALNLDSGAELKAQGAQGGSIHLLAQQAGLNQAANLLAQGTQQNGGQVLLQAASLLDSQGSIQVDGQLNGGLVSLQAEQIRLAGYISADAQQNGGVISLIAASAITQFASSTLSAQAYNGQGGSINLNSLTLAAAAFTTVATGKPINPPVPNPGSPNPSQTLISGNIRVNGRRGGSITISGDHVGLLDNANLQANGQENGGSIKIGGGAHGQDSSVANAQATYIAATARISANGGFNSNAPAGNGGQIVVWSDLSTKVYGSLSANAGELIGNGGFIETSGHWLDTSGAQVSAVAANGQSGTWLLDPFSLTVSNNASLATPSSTGIWTASCDCSVVLNTDINAELNKGTSVVLQTSGNAQNSIGFGDITINNAISKTAGGDASLTLYANRNININANISSTVGKLNLNLNANTDGVGGGSSSIVSGVTVGLNGGALTYNQGLTLNGMLQGGSLVSQDNSRLSGSSGILNGITIASNITANNAYLTIENGLTLLSAQTFNVINGYLYFSGTSNTINTTGAASIILTGTNLNLASSGENLVLANGITLSGYGTISGAANTSLTNQGLIQASTANQTLSITTPQFTNHGTLDVNNSGILSINSSAWTNPGILSEESGGSLNLGGVFSVADLGQLNRAAGTYLYLTGTLDNSSNPHHLDIGSGGLFGTGGLSSLYGGTISGGTLISSDGTQLSGSGTLQNVTIGDNSHTTLGLNGTNVNVLGNLTINSSVELDIIGSVDLNTARVSDQVIINGTIALQSGSTLNLGAGINGSGTGLGGWTNNGTISEISGALLELNGNFNATNLGTIDRSNGGDLYVTGNLTNNYDGNLDIGNSGQFGAGGLTLLTGTIIGGSIVSNDLSPQLYSSSGTLQNVSIDSSLVINGSINIINDINGMAVTHDLTLNNGSNISISNGDLTLSNGVTFDISSSSLNFLDSSGQNIVTPLSSTATLKIENGSINAYSETLTIAAGVAINLGGFSYSYLHGQDIVNNGSIQDNALTLIIDSSVFTNSGSLSVGNSVTLDLNSDTWSNTGILSETSGATLNLGGNFTTADIVSLQQHRTGGQVNITGTLDNSDHSLNIGSSGQFGTGGLTQLSGTITGGTLIDTDGTPQLNSSGGILQSLSIVASGLVLNTDITFQDVIIASNVVFDNSNITISNGLTINSTFTVSITGNVNLITPNISDQIDNEGTIALQNGATLNLGSGLNGSGIGAGGWTNNGIISEVNGAVLELNGNFVTDAIGNIVRNNGSVLNLIGNLDNSSTNSSNPLDIGSNGNFGIGGLNLLNGVISGGALTSTDATPLQTGVLSKLVNVTIVSNDSTNIFGINGATITVQGNLTIDSGAELDIYGLVSLYTPSNTDQIINNGTIALQISSTLNLGGSGLGHWNNTGSTFIELSGATLNLGGNFISTQLGTITRSGTDTLNITGNLNNSGSSSASPLDIDNNGQFGVGGLNQLSGSISGGYLISSGGAQLQSANGRLQDVTIASNLTVNGLVNITSSGNMALAHNLSLLNGGAITSTGTLTNSGSLSVSVGTLTINSSNWVNTGSLSELGGTLNLNSGFGTANFGTFHRAGATTLNLGGIFNNASHTLDIGSNGLFGSGGLSKLTGTITGGTLKSSDGTLLKSSSGTLDAVSLGSNLGLSSLIGSNTVSISNGLTLNSFVFTNNGTVTLNSGTLSLNPGSHWANNNGIVNQSGGVLTLAGNFNFTKDFATTFNHYGGTTNASGTLDNTNQSLDIANFTQFNGTIHGGILTNSNSSGLNSADNITLDAVTLGGSNFYSKGANTIEVLNGLTLANNLTLYGDNTRWVFDGIGNQQLSSLGHSTVSLSGGTVYSSTASSVLSIGSGITFSGYGFLSYGVNSSGNIVNNGTIEASNLGQTLWINPGSFTNHGTLEALYGGVLKVGDNATSWSSDGNIKVIGVKSELDLGGHFSTTSLANLQRICGNVNITGILNNAGKSLDIGNSGQFGSGGLTQLSGTIANGTLLSGDGTVLNSVGGSLNNIALGSNLSVNGDIAINSLAVNLNNADYASLMVSGKATLSGILTLSGISSDQSYSIIKAGSLSGRFANWDESKLSGTYLNLNYSNDALTLSFVNKALEQDIHVDSQVIVAATNISTASVSNAQFGIFNYFNFFNLSKQGNGFFDESPKYSGPSKTDPFGTTGEGEDEFGSGSMKQSASGGDASNSSHFKTDKSYEHTKKPANCR